jgi:hypothetical protein
MTLRDIQTCSILFANRILSCIFIVSLLSSCDINPSTNWSAEKMRLYPLSPKHIEFSNDTGNYRIDYYYINGADISDIQFREKLREQVDKEHAKLPKAYDVSSIYIYQKTETLNENFAGNAEALRGVYDNDLVSYSRWNKQDGDVFYLIENGNVVFDMILNEEISTPWEFD